MQSDSDLQQTKADLFHRLLFVNQTRIYVYILTMIGHYSDADDVMQETISSMWDKFNEYKEGSDFVSWGIKFAYYRILNYRRRSEKHGIVQYNTQLIETISYKALKNNKNIEERFEKLRECLKQLSEKYFMVVKLRYFEEINVEGISGRLGLSSDNVYKILSRAHGMLVSCLKRTAVTDEKL